MSALALLVDADDTLWENAVYFEEAIEQFVDFLDHSALTPAEVRQVLDEIEIGNIGVHGYGSKSFARNLRICFENLAERHYTQADLDCVVAIGEAILERPIELIEGVEETLGYLAERHRLTLFTKGHDEEQLAKLDRSSLGHRFRAARVVREKDARAYREVVEAEGWPREATWMIGNSPKSDIRPALEAGLGAVLVPHERTWALELDDVPEPGERFRIVQRFAELRAIF